MGTAALPCLSQVEILDPASGSYLSGEYDVIIAAQAPEEVVRTKLFLDGQLVFDQPGWVAKITLPFGEAIERHELVATVVDDQGQEFSSQPVITKELSINVSTTSRIILLSVNVKTRSNKPILGLVKDQFSIFENGKELEIQTFYDEKLPLDLVFLLDTSSSLKVKGIEEVKLAAATFLNELDPSDKVNLFEIKKEPIRLLDFTTDRKRLVEKIEAVQALGETALFDSLLAALNELKGRQRGRKAIVLFTDGRDSIYEEPAHKAFYLRTAIIKAQNQEVSIYTIGLGNRIHKLALQRISEETGGRFHFADNAGKLRQIFADIVLDLKNQYMLGVRPQSTRSGFQKMEIKVRKRGAVVYARKGYTNQ